MKYKYVLIFAGALLFTEFFLGGFLKGAPVKFGKKGSASPATGKEIATGAAPSSSVYGFINRIVDGDTVQLSSGEKLRYIGMDTPEIVDPRKPVQCFGREAAQRNKELVEGKTVRLEKDISETDKYGRLLRYVYVPVGAATGTEIFVNLELVKDGYARIFTYPPDVKYAREFKLAEAEARKAKRGLWGSCPVIK